jgi:hypothetical protein
MHGIAARGHQPGARRVLPIAALGLKGVVLSALPNGMAYPLPQDDRFWAAAGFFVLFWGRLKLALGQDTDKPTLKLRLTLSTVHNLFWI